MEKVNNFTTSCGFCGVELVLPECQKYRYKRNGEKVLKSNHFCDAWCYNQFQKVSGPAEGFVKYLQENRGELIKRGIKLGSQKEKIYTSEFLRNLQASTKPNCAYPDCDLEINKQGPRSKWNCCAYHTALVTRAVWAQNKNRKDLVKKHGVEPIEQTFEYLPPATLVCANCKNEFVRSGKRSQAKKTNVFCSKKCQYAFHPKTVEVDCATCGTKFTCHQSRLYTRDKSGNKVLKKQIFCSRSCHHDFIPESNKGGRRLKQRVFSCKHCKKEFSTLFSTERIYKDGKLRKKQQYCSVKCYGAHVREKGLRRTIELKTIYCLECGKKFKTIYYPASGVDGGRIQKFCSVRCGAFYRGPIRKKVKCAQCKKFFHTPNYKTRTLPSGKVVSKQKYCGNKCYKLARQADKKEVACKVCGKMFTTYYYRDRVVKGGKIHKKQKFCSRKCFGTTLLKTGGNNVSSNKREK